MFSESFTTARAPVNLEISQVLAGAFAAIGRHWLTFLILGLVLYGLPYAVTQSFQEASVSHYSGLSQILAATAQSTLISLPFFYLFQPVFFALASWIVWADASKTRNDLSSALRAVARRVLWIVLANLIVSVVAGFGLVLLLVPGIIAILAFWVTTPVCAVEHVTATTAISRSLLLTRGQRWRLLGLLAIIWVLSVVAIIILGLVSMMAGFSFAGWPGLPGIALRGVVSGLLGVFGAACNGSAYVELRTAKEGIGAHDLAAVFA